MSARGLAIDTALASGEEFPRFVEFWLERPQPHADALVFYALLDSPRATGAYRFAFTPGDDSVVEVTARVYLRDKVGKLGIAPLTSMYFHGANQRAAGDDYRPEVHDSDGLSIQSKTGEWIWRPLVNPKRLLVTSFAQRQSARLRPDAARSARSTAIEDLSTRYEAHPSAWVEPIGEWGPGRVELVQIPAPDETNDNIVAYWISDRAPAPKQPIDLHYRVHWQKDDADASADRVGRRRRCAARATCRSPTTASASSSTTRARCCAICPRTRRSTPTFPPTRTARSSTRRCAAIPQPAACALELHLRRIDDTKPVELRAALRSGNDGLGDMELRAAARLNRDAAPAAVCEEYLAALALAPDERARIVRACAAAAPMRAPR